MQAGLICLFIEQRWGFEQLAALLRQFTRDTSTAGGDRGDVQDVAGGLRQGVRCVRARALRALLAGIDEWQKQYQAARKAIESEQWADAIEPARKRASSSIRSTSGPAARTCCWRARSTNSAAAPRRSPRSKRIASAGGWDPAALRELARWLDEAGRGAGRDRRAAVAELCRSAECRAARAARRTPARPTDRAEDSLREFRVLLALQRARSGAGELRRRARLAAHWAIAPRAASSARCAGHRAALQTCAGTAAAR